MLVKCTWSYCGVLPQIGDAKVQSVRQCSDFGWRPGIWQKTGLWPFALHEMLYNEYWIDWHSNIETAESNVFQAIKLETLVVLTCYKLRSLAGESRVSWVCQNWPPRFNWGSWPCGVAGRYQFPLALAWAWWHAAPTGRESAWNHFMHIPSLNSHKNHNCHIMNQHEAIWINTQYSFSNQPSCMWGETKGAAETLWWTLGVGSAGFSGR